MVRPTKDRRVEFIPAITCFKPAGMPASELKENVLTIEELEAVRLKDLEGLEQEECAQRMQISRGTFQRILSAARFKVAQALIEGRMLRFEGGNFKLAVRHLCCASCGYIFEQPFGTGKRACEILCPQCGQQTVHRCENGSGHGFRHRHGKRD